MLLKCDPISHQIDIVPFGSTVSQSNWSYPKHIKRSKLASAGQSYAIKSDFSVTAPGLRHRVGFIQLSLIRGYLLTSVVMKTIS